MNQQAKLRAYVTLVVGSLALAAFVLAITSCAALKSSASVAGGGAAGAALGSLAGPGGAIGGAAIGAAGAKLYTENDELRSGDLIGKDALIEELKRRGEKIGTLEADLARARSAEPANLWQTIVKFWWRFVFVVMAVLGLRMLWFEREHLRAAFAALSGRDPFGAFVATIKAFFGAARK